MPLGRAGEASEAGDVIAFLCSERLQATLRGTADQRGWRFLARDLGESAAVAIRRLAPAVASMHPARIEQSPNL